MAVVDILKTVKELYPSSNIIAMIREKAVIIETELRQKETLQIAAETEKERVERWGREAVPMPEDCKLALEKLGAKFDYNSLIPNQDK